MKTSTVVLTAALLLTAAMPAAAATYVTDTASFTGIGDSIGSTYDIVTLNSVTGTATGAGTYLVNTVDFTAGINASSSYVDTGTFTNTATVDGSPFSYTVPYTISIAGTDTITIGGNTVYTNGVKVVYNPLTLTSGGSTVTGDLTATVSVPEPATWAMMILGAGFAGVSLRRRRQSAIAI